MKRSYKLILFKEKKGFTVYIPAFDGWTQGKDFEDALYMAKDYMKCMVEEGFPIPKEKAVSIKNADYEHIIEIDFDEILSNTLISKVKQKDFDKNVWIYEQSEDMHARYLLGKNGKKKLICCGVNPSYASPEDLDPTMKNVEFFVKKFGFDGYVMINLYPQRATNPKDLHKEKDEALTAKNIELIESVFASGDCEIWAAWGTVIEQEPYLTECLKELVDLADKHNVTWFTIGPRSKKGHPHHPLYLNRDTSEKESFNVHSYLKELTT